MDYSLLLIVEKTALTSKNISSSRNIVFSKDMKSIYHIGIIDYLQVYNNSKLTETLLKSRFYTHKKSE